MRREDLERFLEAGLSLEAIGRQVHHHPSTVSYWIKKYGLTANGASKYGLKPSLDRDALRALVAEGLSVATIAQRLGVTPGRVRRALRSAGLNTRQGSNRVLARAALARGDRVARLTCKRHGLGDHVLDGRGSYRCMRCRVEQVAEHRRKLKRVLVAEMGGRCAICGYDRCDAALEFHHLDPARKSFTLSVRGVTRSLSSLRAEARKCMLLCATCHAEVEAGLTTLDIATAGA
jgi:transposase-like protein